MDKYYCWICCVVSLFLGRSSARYSRLGVLGCKYCGNFCYCCSVSIWIWKAYDCNVDYHYCWRDHCNNGRVEIVVWWRVTNISDVQGMILADRSKAYLPV